MSVQALEYEVVAHTRTGGERIHRYASDEPLQPGEVLRLEGRWWLVEGVEPEAETPWPRAPRDFPRRQPRSSPGRRAPGFQSSWSRWSRESSPTGARPSATSTR